MLHATAVAIFSHLANTITQALNLTERTSLDLKPSPEPNFEPSLDPNSEPKLSSELELEPELEPDSEPELEVAVEVVLAAGADAEPEPELELELPLACWTRNVPPKGPLTLLLLTLTWQRLEMPLTVPVQEMSDGMETVYS